MLGEEVAVPQIMGTVAGRSHGVIRDATTVDAGPHRRSWMPFDFWEAALIERWKAEGVGCEEIARRTMRTARQIEEFDPVRPNGRRGW